MKVLRNIKRRWDKFLDRVYVPWVFLGWLSFILWWGPLPLIIAGICLFVLWGGTIMYGVARCDWYDSHHYGAR